MNNTKRRKLDFSNQKLEKNTKLKNLVKNFFLRSFSRPLALKKLDELIFKYFLPTFVITFFISLFVIVCQFLYVWMDEIVGKGLDWPTIFEFLFFLNLFLLQFLYLDLDLERDAYSLFHLLNSMICLKLLLHL